MKSLKFKLKALAGVLIGLFIAISTAQAAEDRLNKTIEKEFEAPSGTLVRIQNRFGHVNIENWDNDIVSISVLVAVEHPNRERAEKMLAAISVSLEKVGNEIIAVTSIDEKLMNSIGGNILGSSSKEIKIDYSVKMPKHLNLSLYNKFGDVFINEITGHAKIEVKYGNLKANRIIYGNLSPLSSLTLGYGNATIEEADWLKLDIKYSNVSITKCRALAILSKYSKINVEQSSSIVVDSKYDNFILGQVSNIIGESGYTNYKIERMDKKLDITSKYGDVKIANVPVSFELIRFNGGYSSINAPISESASYTLNGVAAYGSITYGSINRVSRIEGNTKIEVSGTVGDESKATAKVIVNIKYGNARFKGE